MDIIYIVITIVMCVIAYMAFAIDKGRAKAARRRIPEKTLLMLSLCGGSLGALMGMRMFHHKTRKPLFTIGVPITLVIWVIIGIFIFHN